MFLLLSKMFIWVYSILYTVAKMITRGAGISLVNAIFKCRLLIYKLFTENLICSGKSYLSKVSINHSKTTQYLYLILSTKKAQPKRLSFLYLSNKIYFFSFNNFSNFSFVSGITFSVKAFLKVSIAFGLSPFSRYKSPRES